MYSSISNILMEYDCLEVINLLNVATVDFSKVFFIYLFRMLEIEVGEMCVVSFTHIHPGQNMLHIVLCKKLWNIGCFSILSSPYHGDNQDYVL